MLPSSHSCFLPARCFSSPSSALNYYSLPPSTLPSISDTYRSPRRHQLKIQPPLLPTFTFLSCYMRRHHFLDSVMHALLQHGLFTVTPNVYGSIFFVSVPNVAPVLPSLFITPFFLIPYLPSSLRLITSDHLRLVPENGVVKKKPGGEGKKRQFEDERQLSHWQKPPCLGTTQTPPFPHPQISAHSVPSNFRVSYPPSFSIPS